MRVDLTSTEHQPATIGDYRVECTLVHGQSYQAIDSAGRRVILKTLDNDCLLKGQLHPLIKDRLARIRELAHIGVANLLAAERADGRAFLVWQYVQGPTLASVIETSLENRWLMRELARQLVQHVESLHALGIVHGALHLRNAILTPDGSLRLTHLSPLLYYDERVDVQAVLEILQAMGCDLKIKPAGPDPLRQIAAKLAANPVDQPPARIASDPANPRRRAVLGALAAIALGAGLAWALWRYAEHHELSRPTLQPHSLIQHSPMPRQGTVL